jgi:hypothetical protein
MEKSPSKPRHENLPPEELAAMRAVLRELASDLPGTMARFDRENPEAAREYQEAERSVIDARLHPFPRDFIDHSLS